MTEKLEANCAKDEVIVMQAARYGRMQLGRCLKVSCEPGYYEIQASRLHQQNNIKTRMHSVGCVPPASVATTRCQYQGGVSYQGRRRGEYPPLGHTHPHPLDTSTPFWTCPPTSRRDLGPGLPTLEGFLGPGIPLVNRHTSVETVTFHNIVDRRQ